MGQVVVVVWAVCEVELQLKRVQWPVRVEQWGQLQELRDTNGEALVEEVLALQGVQAAALAYSGG